LSSKQVFEAAGVSRTSTWCVVLHGNRFRHYPYFYTTTENGQLLIQHILHLASHFDTLRGGARRFKHSGLSPNL